MIKKKTTGVFVNIYFSNWDPRYTQETMPDIYFSTVFTNRI